LVDFRNAGLQGTAREFNTDFSGSTRVRDCFGVPKGCGHDCSSPMGMSFKSEREEVSHHGAGQCQLFMGGAAGVRLPAAFCSLLVYISHPFLLPQKPIHGAVWQGRSIPISIFSRRCYSQLVPEVPSPLPRSLCLQAPGPTLDPSERERLAQASSGKTAITGTGSRKQICVIPVCSRRRSVTPLVGDI